MLSTVVVILTLTLLYWFPVRRWFARWGTTDADLSRGMAGDRLLINTTYSGTMAVSIDALPEHVWPWLVQNWLSTRRAV